MRRSLAGAGAWEGAEQRDGGTPDVGQARQLAWGNESQRAVLHAIAEDIAKRTHHKVVALEVLRADGYLEFVAIAGDEDARSKLLARPRRSRSSTSSPWARRCTAGATSPASGSTTPCGPGSTSTATSPTSRPPTCRTVGTPTDDQWSGCSRTPTASCAACSTSTSRCRGCDPRPRSPLRSTPPPGPVRGDHQHRRARELYGEQADGQPARAAMQATPPGTRPRGLPRGDDRRDGRADERRQRRRGAEGRLPARADARPGAPRGRDDRGVAPTGHLVRGARADLGVPGGADPHPERPGGGDGAPRARLLAAGPDRHGRGLPRTLGLGRSAAGPRWTDSEVNAASVVAADLAAWCSTARIVERERELKRRAPPAQRLPPRHGDDARPRAAQPGHGALDQPRDDPGGRGARPPRGPARCARPGHPQDRGHGRGHDGARRVAEGHQVEREPVDLSAVVRDVGEFPRPDGRPEGVELGSTSPTPRRRGRGRGPAAALPPTWCPTPSSTTPTRGRGHARAAARAARRDRRVRLTCADTGSDRRGRGRPGVRAVFRSSSPSARQRPAPASAWRSSSRSCGCTAGRSSWRRAGGGHHVHRLDPPSVRGAARTLTSRPFLWLAPALTIAPGDGGTERHGPGARRERRTRDLSWGDGVRAR